MDEVLAVVAVILGPLLIVAAMGYLQHVEKMECMKQHGQYIDRGCVFPNAK